MSIIQTQSPTPVLVPSQARHDKTPISAPVLLIGPPPPRPMWAHYLRGAGYGLDAMAGALLTSRPVLVVMPVPALGDGREPNRSTWGLHRPLYVPRMSADVITAALIARGDVEHPAAVLTLDPAHTQVAAELAAALGLPGLGVGAADVLADRLATRDRLQLAGVLMPTLTTATGPTAVDLAADEIGQTRGYPVMLRTRARTPHSSVLVTSRDQIPAALQHLPGDSAQVLVEAHVPHLVTVICATRAGAAQIVAVVRHSDHDAGHQAGQGGHVAVVDAADPLRDDARLADIAQRTLTTLEVSDGLHHLHIGATGGYGSYGGHGQWVLTDVETGAGSPMIVRLVELACGIDLTRLALELVTDPGAGAASTGSTPPTMAGIGSTPVRQVAAAVCSTAPPPDADARARMILQPGVDRLIWHHRLIELPGDDWPIGLPYGYGIVTAPAADLCRERALALQVELAAEPTGKLTGKLTGERA